MATLSDLEQGLRDRLATIPGLRVHTEQPDTVKIPAAWPMPRDGDSNEAFGGATNMTVFDIVVVVQAFDAAYSRGQRALDPYISSGTDKSIADAIEADGTLGGVAHCLSVERWYDRGIIDFGDVAYWGAKCEVQVWH